MTSPSEYRRVKRRFRRMVERRVDPGASIAVVSRGDDDLLEFMGVCGTHFPQDVSGEYAGFDPSDGTGLIAHLEWLRAQGLDWLAFPESSSWWLESYPRFAKHLREMAGPPLVERGAGVVYRLTAPQPEERAPAARILGLLDAWDTNGSAPSLLAWESGLDLERALGGRTVFSPPDEAETLPYLDGSVDIVVVDAPERLSEARRVARRSVVVVDRRHDRAGLEIEHLNGGPPRLPSVSVVIPTYNGLQHLVPCLRGLTGSLPDPFEGEVIVVDDGSGPETVEMLKRSSERLPWLRVVRNDHNIGFIGSCNRAAQVAEGRYTIFLNDDTVPLRGWIEALLGTFDAFPDAGAVGGRLVYPDGRLQEAGGVIYRDGSGANIGRGDWEVDAPRYTWVRRVDYCSGALLATPTELFSDLGGFDTRYLPAYYEDTDYCFRLREAGRSVYYQPRATVVHTEGATSGVDSTAGVKRYQVRNRELFRNRWSEVLDHHALPPDRYTDETWQILTVAGSGQEVDR